MATEDGEFRELCAEILGNWNSPAYSKTAHHNPFSLSNASQSSIHVKPLSNAMKEKEKEKKSDQPIIPVLLADTFFDKLLQCGVDGIDIAALNTTTETEECKINHTASNKKVSTNVIKTLEDKDKDFNSGHIASGFKNNFRVGEHMQTRTYCKRWFDAKLRFMLPLNKSTIFDINIDNLEEKLWRDSAMDISDFFNYGLDEKQWKDYCRVIHSHIRAPSLRQSSRLLYKERATGEGNLDRRIYERNPYKYLKDSSFHDSDVIIEIVQHDSLKQNVQREKHTKPLPGIGKAKHSKCRMINGETILPFPLDSYPISPTEHRDKKELKRQQMGMHDDAHIKGSSREKIDFSENNLYVTNYIHKRTCEISKTIGQNTLPHKKMKQSVHSIATKEW